MTTTENPAGTVEAPPTNSSDAPRNRLSNFTQRVVTSLLLLPVVLGLTFLGGWPFVALASFVGLVGLLEFYALARGRGVSIPALPGITAFAGLVVSFFTGSPVFAIAGFIIGGIIHAVEVAAQRRAGAAWRHLGHMALMQLAGIAYLGLPIGFFVALRADSAGLLWVFLVYALTWGTDTFAYLGGRVWGRRPLAPIISPKKTVEGAIVGWSAGTTAALIVLAVNDQITPASVLLVVGGPGIAILGDLVESMMKRFFRVKDSHLRGLDLFPGHGGVLDRTDSLILVVTLCYVYSRIVGLG